MAQRAEIIEALIIWQIDMNLTLKKINMNLTLKKINDMTCLATI